METSRVTQPARALSRSIGGQRRDVDFSNPRLPLRLPPGVCAPTSPRRVGQGKNKEINKSNSLWGKWGWRTASPTRTKIDFLREGGGELWANGGENPTSAQRLERNRVGGKGGRNRGLLKEVKRIFFFFPPNFLRRSSQHWRLRRLYNWLSLGRDNLVPSCRRA